MSRIVWIIVVVVLIVLVGVTIYYFNSNANVGDNVNRLNDIGSSVNRNGNLDIEAETTENQNTQFTIGEPIFGKIDQYYYRGQENPIIDIELYNDSVIFYNSVLKVLQSYPSYTRLTWKSFPLLGVFPDRIYFAEALECAGEQDKFWNFLDAYSSGNLFNINIRKFGQEFIDNNQDEITKAGLDKDQFNKCFIEERYKDLVTDMNNEAINEGIDGVPITFVNNIKVPGAHEDNLRNVVHEELKKKLMQDWKIFYDSDFNVKFLYPDTIQINKVSSPSDDLQRVDLVDKQSNNIFQIYYYKNGADERLTELKNLYDIKRIGIYNITEINQNDVHYIEQLLTMKDGSEVRSKIDIGYLDTEIIDGLLTVVDELNIEIWGPNSDFSSEFIKILSIGVEINKL